MLYFFFSPQYLLGDIFFLDNCLFLADLSILLIWNLKPKYKINMISLQVALVIVRNMSVKVRIFCLRLIILTQTKLCYYNNDIGLVASLALPVLL